MFNGRNALFAHLPENVLCIKKTKFHLENGPFLNHFTEELMLNIGVGNPIPKLLQQKCKATLTVHDKICHSLLRGFEFRRLSEE